MLRRCALELSSSSSRRCKLLASLSSKTHFVPRNTFSSAPLRPPQTGGSADSAPSGGIVPKLFLGGIVIGAVVFAAREAGYISIGGLPKGDRERRQLGQVDRVAVPSKSELVGGDKDEVDAVEDVQKAVNLDAEELEKKEMEAAVSSVENTLEGRPIEVRSLGVREDGLPGVQKDDFSEENQPVLESELPSNHNVDTGSHVEASGPSSEEENVLEVPVESEIDIMSTVQLPAVDGSVEGGALRENIALQGEVEEGVVYETQEAEPLAKSYLLQEEENPQISSIAPFSGEEIPVTGNKVSRDDNKNDKIVLDFLEAIHAAEKRQLELDICKFEEEKKLIKEMYDKELRDARAREIKYAEELSILEKELVKEKDKAATTVKMLQEEAEQNLKSELQHKEEEAELKLKNARELAKAELNAALALEKSSHLEKIAESNMHIDALCMAFFALSEEVRQNNSAQKLALGVLAVEETLSKGLPILEEVEALRASFVDTKIDLLLDLVLSSLPDETVHSGTDTRLLLNQQFDDLKATVRHFSFIPQGGGGILTHAVAYIASFIKVKETNVSGDGIESVISRVEKLLAEGEFGEAVDALKQGVSGTAAEGAIQDWARRAKNRAIVDQAASIIRSYTTLISLT